MAPILSEFDAKKKIYADFTEKLQHLTAELLRAGDIQVHSVVSRLKDRAMLERKLNAEPGKYRELGEITDLIGVRIVTYFSEDVDRVSKVIEREFEIDWSTSIDKRATLDPDRFGYLSLHYIVTLGAARAVFRENQRFTGIKAEIQIRSILQHAWAEIEHDLGYKTELAVPRDIRRRFSRLAGLLELVDGEFVAIRNELANYEADVPAQIRQSPQSVLIDKASLTAFIENSVISTELDSRIATLCSATVNQNVHPFSLEGDVAALEFLGVKTIADLEKSLNENRNEIITFARLWLTEAQPSVTKGVSLLYLTYVLAAKSGDIAHIREAIEKIRAGLETERQSLAEEVLVTWYRITRTPPPASQT